MEPSAMKTPQGLTLHNTGSVEVVGSIPSGSTKLRPKNLAITTLIALESDCTASIPQRETSHMAQRQLLP